MYTPYTHTHSYTQVKLKSCFSVHTRSNIEHVVAKETIMDDNGDLRVVSVAEDAMNMVGSQLSHLAKEHVNSEVVLRAYAMVVIYTVNEAFVYDGRMKV